MRVDNKVGFSPHGRRLGRGLVALVAIATLLSAPAARAAVLPFQIDVNQSWLSVELLFSEAALGGYSPADDDVPYPHLKAGQNYLYLGNLEYNANQDVDSNYTDPNHEEYPGFGSFVAQPNRAPLSGSFSADISVGSQIQIQPGAVVVPVDQFPYYPWRPLATPFPPNGIGVGGVAGKLAQFGFDVHFGTAVGDDDLNIQGAKDNGSLGKANIYDLQATIGSLLTLAGDGGSPMPFLGGTSYLAYDVSLFNFGQLDIASSLITDDLAISGVPQPIGGGFASNANPPTTDAVVTWDGTTLTIPVVNRIVFEDDGTMYDVRTQGVIIATVVPEPSSVALLACGAIGLIGYVVRRKRRA